MLVVKFGFDAQSFCDFQLRFAKLDLFRWRASLHGCNHRCRTFAWQFFGKDKHDLYFGLELEMEIRSGNLRDSAQYIQNKELTQLRNEVVSLRQRLEEIEHTIHELQAENAKLKSLS